MKLSVIMVCAPAYRAAIGVIKSVHGNLGITKKVVIDRQIAT